MQRFRTRSLSHSFRRSSTLYVAGILGATLLMALSAHVALPLPFSPVPVTGQTLALPLVVALLGTRGATLSMVLYLAEGAAGLPVFAPGVPVLPGILKLLGPTGGYLAAFPVAAFVTGRLFDAGLRETYPGRAAAILAGSLVVLLGGAAWLSHFTGLRSAASLGVAPFVLGDVVKSLVAAALVPLVADR